VNTQLCFGVRRKLTGRLCLRDSLKARLCSLADLNDESVEILYQLLGDDRSLPVTTAIEKRVHFARWRVFRQFNEWLVWKTQIGCLEPCDSWRFSRRLPRNFWIDWSQLFGNFVFWNESSNIRSRLLYRDFSTLMYCYGCHSDSSQSLNNLICANRPSWTVPRHDCWKLFR
jgi:hypothetical protein